MNEIYLKIFFLLTSTKDGILDVKVIGMGSDKDMRKYMVEIAILKDGTQHGFRSTTFPSAIGTVIDREANFSAKETKLADVWALKQDIFKVVSVTGLYSSA